MLSEAKTDGHSSPRPEPTRPGFAGCSTHQIRARTQLDNLCLSNRMVTIEQANPPLLIKKFRTLAKTWHTNNTHVFPQVTAEEI